jgi:hypothetical protein
MRCSIHQPNYIPYLGFFDKYKKSDIFILYDTAQYSKNDFHNRNKIKTAKGSFWLTIPVSVHLGQKIREIKVADKNILERHLDIIKQHYRKSENFNDSFHWLARLYGSISTENLIDITIPILLALFELIDNTKKIILASELKIDQNLRSTSALVAMCKKIGADEYLSGIGAHDYLNENEFYNAGIKVIWQEFKHPIYPQLYGEFMPNLSIVDALMNVGTDGLKSLLK